MDQTYYQTATMLPASKKGALLPRPQGDGMDSETLKIRELTPSRILTTPSRGRQNLASSPKTTTVSKNKKPHFIPHEPLKGAVKPVAVATKEITPPPRSSLTAVSDLQQIILKSNAEQIRPNGSNANRANLNAPQDTLGQTCYNYNTGYGKSFWHQQYEKPVVTSMIRTINVPIYNAPGHLSHNTYKIMEKQQKIKADQFQPARTPPTTTIIPQPQDMSTVKISMIESDSEDQLQEAEVCGSSHEVTLTIQDVLEEARHVEGDARTASMADLEKLNDEINELRRELENQCKVNTDLKKLLVASMGDDLHYKVARLVQDKQQLAAEVGCYTKKMYQDYEDIDKLSIQADMWRSKFKASRVMTDQLTQQNSQLTQNHQSAHQALQRLLQERQQIKEWLSQAHSILYHVKTAFEPKHTMHPPRTGPQTLLSLAQASLQLADNVKFRLLGPPLSWEDGVGAGTVDALSPAEAYAFQVLSTPTPAGPEMPRAPLSTIPYTVAETYSRFHPAAKHDNLTFNVCSRCKGEIHLV